MRIRIIALPNNEWYGEQLFKVIDEIKVDEK